MVYKRYIKKKVNGKIKVYGPYYQHSKKENGKVISEYHGKEIKKKINPVKGKNKGLRVARVLIVMSLLLVLCFIFLNDSVLTGKVSMSISDNYVSGDEIKGSVKINLDSGEFLPADTIVLIENGGEIYSFLLRNLISEKTIEGSYFLLDKEISGSGLGYGVAGEKIIYPKVNFVMNISEDEGVDGEFYLEENDETEIEGDAVSITGESAGNSEIEGTVSYDEPYEYNLNSGQTANIVSSEQEVELNVEEGVAIVTTEYSEVEEGFGEDYISDDDFELEIDLTELNLAAVDGNLNVKLVYNDVEIVSANEEINVENSEENLTEVNSSILNKLNESVVESAVNETIVNETVEVNEFVSANLDTTQFGAVVGMPVKWKKNIKLSGVADNLTVELPKEAGNIVVYKVEDSDGVDEEKTEASSFITGQISAEIDLNERPVVADFFRKIFGSITGRTIDVAESSDKVEVTIDEDATEFEIEYETPGPVALEEETSSGKLITISSDVHYQNILSFAELPRETALSDIKLYHYVDGKKVLTDFQAYDSNGNLIGGDEVEVVLEDKSNKNKSVLYGSEVEEKDVSVKDILMQAPEMPTSSKESNDSSTNESIGLEEEIVEEQLVSFITWIVPHLSNQTYEIIIEISNAEHLDSDRNFIEDIYDEVSVKDGVWKEIGNSEYVRVTFEELLDSSNDITVYARGEGSIEIYLKGGEEVVAVIEDISEEGWYKTYLTEMTGEQDVFDLKILGDLEFDLIIDPSFNPNNENDIGYEFLTIDGDITNASDGDVVHIWNTQDDYFFNKSAGIQLTNHFQDYWTKNIMCIGYYNATGTWIKIYCADELSNFNRNIQTDNVTYVNATLWKDISYGSYDLRLGIRYYLGVDDQNLSVIIYAQNIGIDIPFDLGFAWKIADWNIPPGIQDDRITINNTNYFLNGTYNLEFENMDEAYLRGYDPASWTEEFLRLDWNENLDYKLKMYGEGDQSTFYTALLINGGHFNPGQEKQTTLYWIDAVTIGTNAGFVVAAPSADPGGISTQLDNNAMAFRTTSPADAATVTEIGWWCDAASEESNYEVAIYSHDAGNDRPDTIVGSDLVNAKGTDGGWKRVTGLNIAISPSTTYWIAVQLDDTATTTYTDVGSVAGLRRVYQTGVSTLNNPWGATSGSDDYAFAYYAVYEAAGGGDVDNPTVTLNEPADFTNYTFATTDLFNCTVFDDVAVDTVLFYWNVSGSWEVNGTDTSGTNNTKYEFSRDINQAGEFHWGCWANDTSGNSTWSSTNYTFSYRQDTTAPTFTTIPANVSGNYLTTSVNADFDFTDETEISMIFINDTSNFTMDNSTGILTNKTPLFVGNYALNVTINDSANNINWTIFTVAVGQIASQGSISGTASITYGTAGDVTGSESNIGDADVVYTLYRNLTSVSNPDTDVLAVNFYSYIYNATAGQNYSANSSIGEFNLTVNQDTSICGVYFNASSPITYPETFIVYTNCSSAYTLSMNGTSISNATEIISGAGAFNFSVLRTDASNYSSYYSEEEFQVSISSSACQVLFNETSPITFPAQFQAYTDCDSDFTFYLNGSAISNDSVVNSGAGTYNISVHRTDVANYSNTFDDEYFVVSQASLSASLTSTKGFSYSYDNSATIINLSESNTQDSDVNYTIYRSNATYIPDGEEINFAVGTYPYIVNSTGGANYSSNGNLDYEVLTITANTESCQVLFNETSGITYPQTFLVWANCSSAFTLYQNGSTISNNSEVISGAGAFNFSFIRTDASNYSTYYNETQFIVSQDSSICGVEFNETSPLQYPKTFLAWSNCSSANYLMRNGTIITNNSEQSLAIGAYNFSTNRTDTSNYSSIYSERQFRIIDTIAPTVILLYPLNTSYENVTEINYTSSESGYCMYSFDDGTTNSTVSASTANFTGVSSSAGQNDLVVYCNDSSNNVGINNTISFTVDTVSPQVSIVLPVLGNTYTSASVTFQVTTDEESTCNYSIDAAVTNSSMTASSGGTIHTVSASLSDGSYTVNYFCADLYSNLNNSESTNFTVAISTTTPPTTISGGGGGGGGAARPAITFGLSSSSFEKTLAVNRIGFGDFEIENTGSAKRTYSFEVETINSIIQLEQNSVDIGPGEKAKIEFKIISPDTPGIFTGKVIVKTGSVTKEILLTINIKTEKSLFDVVVTIPKTMKVLKFGNNLGAQIDLLEMGLKEKKDITLNYMIKDFDGIVYLTESETIAVTDQKTIQKEFYTADLPAGDYILGTEVIYPEGVAVSSSQFKVREKVGFEIENTVIIILVAVFLILFVSIALIIRRYRKILKAIK